MRRIAAILVLALTLALTIGLAPRSPASEAVIPSTSTPDGSGASSSPGAIIDGEEDEATPPSTGFINTTTTIAEPAGEEETNEPTPLETEAVVAVGERDAWFWLPLLVALAAGALLFSYAASTVVVDRGRAGRPGA